MVMREGQTSKHTKRLVKTPQRLPLNVGRYNGRTHCPLCVALGSLGSRWLGTRALQGARDNFPSYNINEEEQRPGIMTQPMRRPCEKKTHDMKTWSQG